MNSKKNIRLSEIKQSYFDGEITKDQALSVYVEWVNQKEYMILGKADKSISIPPRVGGTFCPIYEINKHPVTEYKAVLLCKRGNDRYSWVVKNRFKPLSLLCNSSKDKKNLFFEKTNSKNHFRCNFLWLTLTYDTKRCDCDTAWIKIGKELNSYLSSLKKKFGRVSLLRSFEAFKNGFPHVHVLLYFHDYKFLVKQYRGKNGKLNHIVVSKKPKTGKQKNDIDYLRGSWHSFIKCSGVKDFGAVGYTLKYTIKELYQQNNYSTSAHLWFYHKQSYSMSQDFVSTLGRIAEFPLLDINMRNSRNFSNEDANGWFYIGTFTTENDYSKWYIEIPPPDWDNYPRNTALEVVFADVF